MQPTHITQISCDSKCAILASVGNDEGRFDADLVADVRAKQNPNKCAACVCSGLISLPLFPRRGRTIAAS